MTQSIPFTSEHDRLIREGIERLGSLEVKTDNLEMKFDALETKFDALETKVDTLAVTVKEGFLRADSKHEDLKVTVQEGFRRTDVMYEDLRSMFNRVIDLVLHTNQKLDAQSGVQEQINNHEVRLDLIESHLKKDA